MNGQNKAFRWAWLGSLFLVLVLTVSWYCLVYPFVSTDDARVSMTLARLSPVGLGGRIEKINVNEGDRVQKGDILLELDQRIVQADYDRAVAKLRLAKQELLRMTRLTSGGSIPTQNLEVAQSNAAMAEADLRVAKTHLENTLIKAPFAGIIVQRTAELGTLIEAGQSAAVLADLKNAWIAANIEETSIGRVRVGQSVQITIDEGGEFEGKVIEIRAATANSFALIPTDNGAGNFIKLTQRIPIKVAVNPQTSNSLRAGQSVQIKIRVL